MQISIYDSMGGALSELRRYGEARDDYERAVELGNCEEIGAYAVDEIDVWLTRHGLAAEAE